MVQLKKKEKKSKAEGYHFRFTISAEWTEKKNGKLNSLKQPFNLSGFVFKVNSLWKNLSE